MINRVGGVVTNGGGNENGDIENDGHDIVEVEEHEKGCTGWVRQESEECMGKLFIAVANLY